MQTNLFTTEQVESHNILAIETSASSCSLAIQTGDQIVAHFEHAPRQQTQRALPMINHLLDTSGVSITELDAIAYGRGPGSFTGVRIAAAVAQGLALVKNIPVIPISSLACIAQSAHLKTGFKKLLVAVRSKPGQIYGGSYIAKQGIVSCFAREVACNLSDFVTNLIERDKENSDILTENEKWFAIGNGWDNDGEPLTDSIHCHLQGVNIEVDFRAEALLPLAYAKIKEKQDLGMNEVFPVYLS